MDLPCPFNDFLSRVYMKLSLGLGWFEVTRYRLDPDFHAANPCDVNVSIVLCSKICDVT